MTARLLVIAIGNDSRGDDALGPALLEALRAAGVGRDGTVELLAEYQLQVEHALDLDGRDAVLFVDASLHAGVRLTRLAADAAPPPHSHALRPQAVLGVFERIRARGAPPAWQLAIGGSGFELGATLTPQARANLARAAVLAHDWLREHGA